MKNLSAVTAEWGANGPIELIAERENAVYRIMRNDIPAVLRLHRAGYQNETAILSELKWTNQLAEAGFPCPTPIEKIDGTFLTSLADGRFASVISWVEGAPIGAADKLFEGSITQHCDLYHNLGCLLAQLHNTSDSLNTDSIIRPTWDIPGLLGKTPFWGRFWENPALSGGEKDFMIYARDTAYAHLKDMKNADFGLIHADALQENVLIDEIGLVLIDFDDAGFGFRGYDLGVPMSQHYTLRYLDDLVAAIQSGYGTLRKAPSVEDIKFFLMLRCFASSGWIISRQPTKSPEQRRYAERALHLAHQWLTTP